MDNYIALLLLVVPGFISRRIYGLLTDQKPARNNFEETIFSLILSVANILIVYIIDLSVYLVSGGTNFFVKDDILESFNHPSTVAIYTIMVFVASFLTALMWKNLQPWYIRAVNFLRAENGRNRLAVSDSVFNDSFNDGEVHWVEVCREDKMVARGILVKMDRENGEFYLQDTEENFQQSFTDDNGKILGYKGYYIDAKNNLLIREVDESKRK